ELVVNRLRLRCRRQARPLTPGTRRQAVEPRSSDKTAGAWGRSSCPTHRVAVPHEGRRSSPLLQGVEQVLVDGAGRTVRDQGGALVPAGKEHVEPDVQKYGHDRA